MSDRLTLEAFAQETGFSARSLRRWIKAGTVVPRRTPGGRPYFTHEDVTPMKAGKRLTADRFAGEVA